MPDDARGRLVVAPNENHLWAGIVVEELVRSGVTAFCVCPGSRSTPLTWAVAEHPTAEAVVHFDERGAAFHALGIAQATGNPVGFVCSSGTAVANAFPAVVEASMSHVPLILLTADRPPELHGVGANQTIDQDGIYGKYVRWDAPEFGPAVSMDCAAALTGVDEAVSRAMSVPRGPVHLNCMFREPLAPSAREGFDAVEVLVEIEAWIAGDAPYVRGDAESGGVSVGDMEAVARLVNGAGHGIVVAGQLSGRGEVEAARKLVELLGWPMFADVTSGLGLGQSPESTIHGYHHLLGTEAAAKVVGEAEAVLHIGGAFTWKPLLEFIEEHAGGGRGRFEYARIGAHLEQLESGLGEARRIETELRTFADALEPLVKAGQQTDYSGALGDAAAVVAKTLASQLDSATELSEAGAVRIITREAPGEGVLFLGNSMPIRDADKYGSTEGNGPLVAANRGASGIDGNIATAAGHARGSGRVATAVMGDLAALHDVNSLALLRDPAAPVILVIINNDGGGIFHFLPIGEHGKHFERFFGTPHGLSFEQLAGGFKLEYYRPSTGSELVETYQSALAADRSCIIEVCTDREANVRLHGELDTGISGALAKLK